MTEEKIDETTFREKVLEAVTDKEVSKEIPIKFPKTVFKRFSKWAYNNANNCYWLAIDKLLNEVEAREDFHEHLRLLADRDDILAMEITRLNNEFAELKKVDTTVVSGRKSFGKKDMKGE